jgi:hypothetical protein
MYITLLIVVILTALTLVKAKIYDSRITACFGIEMLNNRKN